MTESDRSAVAEILESLYVAFGKKADAGEKRQFLDVLWSDIAAFSIQTFKTAARDIRTREGDTDEEKKRRAYFPTIASIFAHCKAVERVRYNGPDGGSWYAANRGAVECSNPFDRDVWQEMSHSFCLKMSDAEIECANRRRAELRIPLLQRTARTEKGLVQVSSWNEYERVQALQNFGAPCVEDLDAITGKLAVNVRETAIVRNLSGREMAEQPGEWFDR